MPVKADDYTFFKKKVRLNVVEKEVIIYRLDQDEIDAKKSSRKRKNL